MVTWKENNYVQGGPTNLDVALPLPITRWSRTLPPAHLKSWFVEGLLPMKTQAQTLWGQYQSIPMVQYVGSEKPEVSKLYRNLS